jgi:hypothetical protein
MLQDIDGRIKPCLLASREDYGVESEAFAGSKAP